jgi:peroxiredoxin
MAALAGAALALALLTALPAAAHLNPGSPAPAFAAQASLGGKVFTFDLAEALRSGPVVLYFYPAAFTPGCTIEAHDFAEHMGEYKKLGATVIGVSGDDIEKLRQFSVSECRGKFPVAADGGLKIATAYDARLGFGPVAYANRTSYVIARDGKIAYAYTALDPEKHVANTLDALRKIVAKP